MWNSHNLEFYGLILKMWELLQFRILRIDFENVTYLEVFVPEFRRNKPKRFVF